MSIHFHSLISSKQNQQRDTLQPSKRPLTSHAHLVCTHRIVFHIRYSSSYFHSEQTIMQQLRYYCRAQETSTFLLFSLRFSPSCPISQQHAYSSSQYPAPLSCLINFSCSKLSATASTRECLKFPHITEAYSLAFLLCLWRNGFYPSGCRWN